jgi:hypothetical protein
VAGPRQASRSVQRRTKSGVLCSVPLESPPGAKAPPRRRLESPSQNGRLKVAKDLPHAKTLTNELVNFKVKISLTGHDSYGAVEDWRQGNHDDLVLALALPCWYGENRLPGPSVAAQGIYQVSDWR